MISLGITAELDKKKGKKMKSIIFLIVMLLTTAFFAQTPNWTSVIETNINVGSAELFGVDIFTNGDGKL
jgi:hypothetical protein